MNGYRAMELILWCVVSTRINQINHLINLNTNLSRYNFSIQCIIFKHFLEDNIKHVQSNINPVLLMSSSSWVLSAKPTLTC